MAEPRIIISCEHGGNEVPAAYGDLFRGQGATLGSHRGWDAGALQVAARLAYSLRVPLYFSTISRLLIDNNRSEGHRGLFSEFSRGLSAKDKAEVMSRYYLPHRRQIQGAVAIANGQAVLHVAIHSFTPVLDGQERRVDIGLLYDPARRNERQLCQGLRNGLAQAAPQLIIRRNYPYRGRSDGLATWLRRQFPPVAYLGIEVEINQRLLLQPDQADPASLADLLARTLLPCFGVLGATNRPDDELVVIVDADNRVVGEASRREMRRQNLIHRATYILVCNRQGQIFVQKRTMSKDIYPGYFDVAAGGVVQSGELYEESAQRELREELGITAELEFLGDRYFADGHNQVWGRVYCCRHEGPFVLQAAEVESGAFMSPDEILNADQDNFTPDGLAILAWWRLGPGS